MGSEYEWMRDLVSDKMYIILYVLGTFLDKRRTPNLHKSYSTRK